jgi:hyperosmotically inducible protein
MRKYKTNMIALFITLTLAPYSSVHAADRMSNDWKEATITTKFYLNDVLGKYNIESEVSGNKVELKGNVSEQVEKELAGEIASNTEGIESVDNNIVVDKEADYAKVAGTQNSIGQQFTDSTTTARVKSRLLWSNGIPGLSVNVSTKNGVTTLKGDVPLGSQKDLAEKLALNTHGVKRVDNQLRVTNDPNAKVGSVDFKKVEKNAGQALESVGDTLSDSWITTKVRTSLEFTRSLNINNLDVSTESGVVTLSGNTSSPADSELASEIAKDIKGVKSLINKIKVY